MTDTETQEVPIPQNVERQAKEADRLFQENNKSVEAQPVEPAKEVPQAVLPDGSIEKMAAIQHKYDVLQGKYNAEVPRLSKSLSDAQELLATQKGEIENLTKIPEAPKIGVLDIEQFKERGIEDEIIEMANTVNQLTANQKNNEVQALAAKVKEYEDSMKTTAAVKAEKSENSFFEKIATDVKDWESVNDDPGFLSWLSENDPFSGVTRREVLAAAQGRLDAITAINIFKTYKGKGNRPTRDLSSEVVPSTTVGADDITPKGSGVTQADVARAANDFARGRLSETEFNKIANEFQKTL